MYEASVIIQCDLYTNINEVICTDKLSADYIIMVFSCLVGPWGTVQYVLYFKTIILMISIKKIDIYIKFNSIKEM